MSRRTSTVIVAGVVIAVGMVGLGMEPRLPLVTLVVAVVATAFFLVYDLGEIVTPIPWQARGDLHQRPSRGDYRVQILRLRLARSERQSLPTRSDGDEPDSEVATLLLDVIDDHLRTTVGVDRLRDPATADAHLPPELRRFVHEPGARRAMTRRRRLASTLSAIEGLVNADTPSVRGSSS